MNKITNIITTVLFILIIFGFAVLGFATPDLEKSVSENRNLAKFPKISIATLLSKGEDNAMTGFENYVSDHFPFRDSFRELKAWIAYNIYGQKVNNGYFLSEGHACKSEDKINENSMDHFADALGNVYNRYFKNRENVFYSVVPDKSYFLSEKSGVPSMDYDKFFSMLRDKLPNRMKYIDITDTLSIEDYYYTDIHWSADKLEKTVRKIAKEMGFEDRLGFDYKVNKLTDSFGGVYFNQAGLNLSPEAIYYIYSPLFDDLKVTVDGEQVNGIYNQKYKEDINGYYTYFLYGSKGNIQIENPNAETDRELVLIRDSFGSSLTPWFIEGYSKITVLDIRYSFPAMLGDYVGNDDNTDVLFLYSTSIINDSSAIKK